MFLMYPFYWKIDNIVCFCYTTYILNNILFLYIQASIFVEISNFYYAFSIVYVILKAMCIFNFVFLYYNFII